MKPFSPSASSSKHRYRPVPVALLVLASLSWADVTLADETSGSGTGSSSGSSQASGPFRTGASSNSASKPSPFAYGSGDTSTDATSTTKRSSVSPVEGETAGAGAGTEAVDDKSSNFVAPNFYGRGPVVVTPGRGQYARPKFRYGASVGIGYDSNPNQVPDSGLGSVAQPREGSGFVYLSGHWDAQWIKPRTVVTANVSGGASFFFNASDSEQYNAQLGLMLIHKIDPRTQFSGNVSLAYLTQPDYANMFASSSEVAGPYITASSKFDLSHRWTPLFSTTSSVSLNVLQYTNENSTNLANNYLNFIAGNEFRFHTSRNYTWVLEGRYDMTNYYDNSDLNTQAGVFLGGLDWILSRRLTSTVRLGASVRSFETGGSSVSPYFEGSVNYLTSRHSSLNLNARYGYEPSNVDGGENESFRLGMLYQHALTSRFSVNTGFNTVITNYNTNSNTTDSSSTVYDISAGLQYRLDRHFVLGLRYNYTLQQTSGGGQDFDRNRVLFSGQYEY